MGVHIYRAIAGTLNRSTYGPTSTRDLYLDFNFMNIIHHLTHIKKSQTTTVVILPLQNPLDNSICDFLRGS